jgi:hypothetical protein
MRSTLAVLLAFIPASLFAQVHSHSERIGEVRFPTTCAPSTAAEFNRSVALLHSFEFGDAILGFKKVLSVDSTCAMAHWGIAMSKWSNPMAAGNRSAGQVAAGFEEIHAAQRFASKASVRERGYIDAAAKLYDNAAQLSQTARVLAYSQAMNDLRQAQPADTEATIFYAISLVASASPTDKTYANQRQAGAILESLWKKEPNHPGLAHYIIHAYDYPALAANAATAAKEYAVIAPSAAHALHMPSHIFTRTGQWRQSIETNLRSMEVAEKSGSIAEALHAADYAEYAYLQMNNDSAAKRILGRLPALAAKFDPDAITGAAPGSAGVFALAAIPARYALERNDWKSAASLVPARSPFPWTEAMTYFARALGGAHTRDFAVASSAIDSLAAISGRLKSSGEGYWSEQVAIKRLGASAWLELARNNSDSALSLMLQAAAREDATEKNAVTPGPLAPARELLGDMLMQLNRRSEALGAYRATLIKEPNRRRSMRAVATLISHDNIRH